MLEAVILITNSYELNSERFNTFIKQFENEQSDLDFLIFTNKPRDIQTLEFRKRVYESTRGFRKVELICLNIPAEDDVDIKNHKRLGMQKIPALGLSSGPNITFFSAMNYCSKYDSVLLLEVDCLLRGYLDSLQKYTECMGDFLISGGLYDGKTFSGNIQSPSHTHLSSVGIYKTSSPELQNLLQEVEKWIPGNVDKYKRVPYDISITMFLHESINKNDGGYYRNILRKMIPTTLILNYSNEVDLELDFNSIDKLFPSHKILYIKHA